MRVYRNDAPLVVIWPIDLDFLIRAASSESVVASGHIDLISYYTSSGISYTLKLEKEQSVTKQK